MAASIPTSTPARLIAGDSWEWKISLSDYPAPTWTLSYYLVKSGTNLITLTGSQYGSSDDHHIDIAKETTDDFTDGTYSFQAVVTDGSDRKAVETGTIVIEPDFAQQSSGYDDRSFAKKSLDAIEAVIANRASQAQQEYQIAGRALKFMTMEELLSARDRLRAEYLAEERMKNGKSGIGSVKVRFKSAS
ncbi:hypothetical protein [Prosthecochloris sp.]|uniref:hypothetical protein n=1 Tax=Prosthecochloris sp. TaxID=290513 RepID=UPI0025CFDB16|nr:hypothetical protein [Prosthecochloris sp.]